jgi:hypothetical protein
MSSSRVVALHSIRLLLLLGLFVHIHSEGTPTSPDIEEVVKVHSNGTDMHGLHVL